MHSCLLVSLDRFLPEHIIYCTHSYPMPHTCSVRREIKGPRTATQQELSISKFTKEYYDRLNFEEDELLWSELGINANGKFLGLLFWQFLKCMNRTITKQRGTTNMKRIEYLVNNQQCIVHRIWLQITYKWGATKGSEYEKVLHLTIADHFKWVA